VTMLVTGGSVTFGHKQTVRLLADAESPRAISKDICPPRTGWRDLSTDTSPSLASSVATSLTLKVF